MKKSFRSSSTPRSRPSSSRPSGMGANARPRVSSPSGKKGGIFSTGGSSGSDNAFQDKKGAPAGMYGGNANQPYMQTGMPRRTFARRTPLIVSIVVVVCCLIVVCIALVYALTQGLITIPSF